MTQEYFPRLALVPTDAILFHEHPEAARTERLLARIREEALLRNPPVVADLGDGKYLLLDGANRVSAFRALNFVSAPVQVVDYAAAEIELKGWHHLIVDAPDLMQEATFANLEGVALQKIGRETLQRHLEFRGVYAVWVDATGRCYGLFPPSNTRPTLEQRMRVLNQVISLYEGQGRLERIKLADYGDLPDVVEDRAHQLCLFPTLTKEEMILLVREQVMIPTGITRHLIPGRALGLNLPLDLWNQSATTAELQAFFAQHIHALEVSGRVRFYEEAVFVMNE